MGVKTADLIKKRCRPMKGVAPLDRETVEEMLALLHRDWVLSDDGRAISRTIETTNYYQTITFVNALAWIANGEDHHPDLHVGYNYCEVTFTTHAIRGISLNDLICAAKLDAMHAPYG